MLVIKNSLLLKHWKNKCIDTDDQQIWGNFPQLYILQMSALTSVSLVVQREKSVYL